MEHLSIFNPIIITMGAIVVAVICYKPYLGILLMSSMLPFEATITFSSGITAIKIMGIITFMAFGFHVLIRKEQIKNELLKFALPLAIFLLWIVLKGDDNYSRLLKLTQLMLYFLLMCNLCAGKKARVDLLFWSYIIACLLSSLLAASGYLTSELFEQRASVGAQNANLFASIIGSAICLLLYEGSKLKGWKLLIPYGIVVPFVYALIIAASRGAVVATCLAILVYLILTRNKLKSIVIVSIICLIVASVAIVGLQKGIILTHSMKRIESTKNYEKTTLAGRFWLWQVGCKMIQDNFITGVGLGNFNKNFNKYAGRLSGYEHDPHNVCISIFAEMGVIGFFIFLWFICSLGWVLIKTRNENTVFSVCLLVYVATVSMKGTMHCTKFFWASIAMAYLIQQYSPHEKSTSSLLANYTDEPKK